MEGAKALALDAFAERARARHAPPRLFGHWLERRQVRGRNAALWLEEALAALDQLTEGPLILVGSSMGGWIALHLALLRPERVQALVGIAAAPDFTEWGFRRKAQAADGDRAIGAAASGNRGSGSCCSTARSPSIARCACSTASAIRRSRSRSRSG